MPPPMPLGRANPSLDFLKQFTDREREQQAAKQPLPFSSDEHNVLRQEFNTVHFIKPKYSDETEINVVGIYRKWKRYCEDHTLGEWQAALKKVDRGTIMSFFLRVCESSGPRIKSSGTTKVYIRQFQQLYTNVTGRYMDRNVAKELYKYHDTILVPRFGYRPSNMNGKPVLGVDDLRAILTFNIAYDTGIQPSEEQRVNMAGILQLLCYTGARPAEIVNAVRKKPKEADEIFKRKGITSTNSNGDEAAENDDDAEVAQDNHSRLLDKLLVREVIERGRPKALCYEDVLMMMVRDPQTGRPIPAMSIKFIHHKGADNKPKPTIFYFTPARKLIFCAVSTIIARALRDDAFDAPSLTSAIRVMKTEIRGPVLSSPLRWKQSMLKVPIFRRIWGDGALSKDEPMHYSKLRDDMSRLSLDAGFEKAWTPRFARRGASNAVNGIAPDTVRDQMMRQDPRFATFYGAYLNENVQFDIQNTFLEEETEDKLHKLFAHVSLTRDPRATRDMVPEEVWRHLPPDPEILKLERRREVLKGGQYRVQGTVNEVEIRTLGEEIRRKQDQRDKAIVKQYREFYFQNRATWDIESQARGEAEELYREPTIDVQIQERARLAQLLCHQQPDCTYDELLYLRAEAIDLMVRLCGKRETARREHIRQRRHAKPHLEEQPPKATPFPLLLDPNQCPDCIGDERLATEERTFRYCRPTVRNDHFDDQHLARRELAEQQGDPVRCNHPQCQHDPRFPTLDAFRRHVQTVHGITLRTSHQVTQRRSKKVQRRRMVKGSSS